MISSLDDFNVYQMSMKRRENGGASILVENNIERIRKEYVKILEENINPQQPELWDGKTAERCLEAILSYEKDKISTNMLNKYE